jgi:chitinase
LFLRHFVLISFFFIALSKRTSGQQLIAYYSGNAQQIREYPVNRLSQIIFSFCQMRGNSLVVGSSRDSMTIRALVALKKKNPSLRILLSLGGWGACKTCSIVFSTDSGREEFVESVFATNGFFHTDGIDLDWEFPSMAAFPGNPFLPDDKLHFNILIKALRGKLGPGMEISVICAGFSPYLEGSLDLPGLVPYVSRINLMTYDLIGSKVHIAGHHSSLYSTSGQAASADRGVRYLDSLKIPRNKVAIGVALYGRLYQVTENHNHGLQQPAQFEKFVTDKEIRKYYTKSTGYTTYWDDDAKAAYKYNDREKLFLTYDDEKSVTAKVSYVKEKGLNGIFFWELRLDKAQGGLVDVMADQMKQK